VTASNESPPQPPEPPDGGPEMSVFVTVAVRTSAGKTPGAVTLPVAEAQSLIGRRLAVAGDQPPRGWPG
jgi:hypothetical protein